MVKLQAMVLFYHYACWLVRGEQTSIEFGDAVEGLSFPTMLMNTKSQPAHTPSPARGQLCCDYDSFFYVGISNILTILTVSLPLYLLIQQRTVKSVVSYTHELCHVIACMMSLVVT